MNILLDAYFDRNYGDDIFVETITGLFPEHKFYSFLEFYPQEVIVWAERIPNLYLLPECEVFLGKNMFDAYICVGGDVFPDNGDYTKRKEYVESVKKINGMVAFLGFSLFHQYGEKTRSDMVELMKEADIIAPRDEASAKILKEILPDREIAAMADLAFLSDWKKKKEQANRILGISVRRPDYADNAEMERYCKNIADVINHYLKQDSLRRVRFFSLSSGLSSDAQVVNSILQDVSDKQRIEHIVYSGDTTKMKNEIRECEAVVCTRLHAMISCIAMNVPFIPIVYEVKMEHILDDIGYKEKRIHFTDISGLQEQLSSLLNNPEESVLWDEELENSYRNKTKKIIAELHEWFRFAGVGQRIQKIDTSGPVCCEKEYAGEQAKIVAQKNKELELMAEEVRKLQLNMEGCQETITQYLRTIEECNGANKEYLQIIEECNKTNREYFGLIEGLNQKIATMEEDKTKQILSFQQEFNVLTEQKKQCQLQMEKLREENDEKTYLLRLIRPFFMSKMGGFVTGIFSRIMQLRNSGIREGRNLIRQYYTEEADK